MRIGTPFFRWLGALGFAASAMVFGCGDDAPLLRCGEIPTGGCPIARGATCDDPACAAVYSCDDGAWNVRTTCSSRDGGLDGSDEDAGADAGCLPMADAAIEQATGCMPDLELPDCPAGVALGCPASACTSGCELFFTCTEEGWSEAPIATCEGDGGLVWREAL